MTLKQVKRIGLILLSLLITLALSVFIVLRFYEDEIGAFAIKKLKTQLTTDFEVKQVGLAFWKTFPNAAVELNTLYVQEKGEESDTLLYAEALYLKFNLWDIFLGSYRVDEVEIIGGRLQLSVNDVGENNWEVWKESSGETSNFEIELEEIVLTDTRVIYNDRPSQFYIDLLAIQTSGSGNFSARNVDVALSLDVLIEKISSKDDVYLENRVVAGEAEMKADIDKQVFHFSTSEIACGDFELAIQGSLNKEGTGGMEFYAEANDELIEDAIDALPATIRKQINGYKVSGDCDVKAKISRSKSEDPIMVELELNVDDGTLRVKNEGLALEDIQTNLYYMRGGKKDQIRLKSFTCSLDRSRIEASGNIVGFETPQLDMKVSAQIQLKDLRDFLDLQQIEICEGEVTAEAALNGTLRYVEADTSYNWRDILATGTASVSGASLKLKNSNRLFNEMTAEFAFDKQNANIRQFSGVVNGTDFGLTGTLFNVVPFLFEPRARVFLDADLKSSVIDFTQLVEEETSTANESDYELLFPALLDFNLKCSIDKFVFRKFEAQGVRGMAILEDGKLTVDPLSFTTADGTLNAQLVLAPISTDSYRLNCLAQVHDIRIDEVFTEFENFGQTFIQDKHLKGIANANVQFRAVVSNALELKSDKIESIIDLSIENGELNNLETLQEIADYLRKNKWVAPFVDEDRFAERMRNVKFSKLENVIEIRNRVVTIPMMDIRSSAMDISAKGTHTFDHVIDYAVGFNLRDLLIRKDKELNEADDGLGKWMYLSMKGTVDNPAYAVDRELAKEVRKESMEAERDNMKALFKDEFGLFKKDHSVGKYKENAEGPSKSTITVEWEEQNGEENQQQPSPAVPPKNKKDEPVATDKATEKKKKTPKWLEEKE